MAGHKGVGHEALGVNWGGSSPDFLYILALKSSGLFHYVAACKEAESIPWARKYTSKGKTKVAGSPPPPQLTRTVFSHFHITALNSVSFLPLSFF